MGATITKAIMDLTRGRPPALDLPDQMSVRWTSLTKIIRNPEQNWPRQILERPIIVGKINQATLALIADPEAAKTVLTGAEDHFPKWKIYDRVFARGLGRQGLSVVQGEQWLRQQKALAPMFRPDRVSHLAAFSRKATEQSCAEWLKQGTDIRIDAAAEMTMITLRAIWAHMFGTVDGDLGPPSLARVAAEISAAQVLNRVNEPPARYTELALEAQQRARSLSVRPSTPFAALGDPELAGGPLSPAELFDNTRLFLGAGSETTALTLTWALWLIGHAPEIQCSAQKEIDQIVGTEPVTVEHVGRLTFVGQVLNETLRLCPPSVVVVRQARDAETLAGERLPSGSILAVCLYALHRHRLWWDAPAEFRPERFAAGAPEPRHPFAFLPFSAGRHACIGKQAGWVEAVTVLATILRHFDVVADSAVVVKPRVSITMRPDRETPVLLHPRRQ
jgi:cytochrome P450